MCDSARCKGNGGPERSVPTMFGTSVQLCTKCFIEWRTMAYNLHMNFMGLLEFEQRAFLGQEKPPDEIQGADTDRPPPMPELARTEEEIEIKTDPGTPDAKKDGFNTATEEGIEILWS